MISKLFAPKKFYKSRINKKKIATKNLETRIKMELFNTGFGSEHSDFIKSQITTPALRTNLLNILSFLSKSIALYLVSLRLDTIQEFAPYN
jgi:hypothetical protein